MQYLRRVRVGAMVGLACLSACARLGANSSGPGLHSADGGPPADGPTIAGDAVRPDTLAPAWIPTTYAAGGLADPGWSGITLASAETHEGSVQLGVVPGFAVKKARLPAPLAWASAATSGPLIAVLGGGLDGDDVALSSKILRYSPLTDTIDAIGDLPAGISQSAAVTAPGGAVFSIKGKDKGFTLEGNLFRLDLIKPWVVKAAAIMEKSFRHTAALGPDGLIYVLGGVGSGPIVNKIEAFDPVLDKMVPIAASLDLVGGREHARAATGANGVIYVFGGALGPAADVAPPTASTSITAEILALDTKAGTIVVRSMLPLPLMNVAVGTLSDGRILIVGGDTQTTALGKSMPTTQVLAFDPTQPSAAPQATTDTLPYPLSGAAAAVAANGKLYLFGGVRDTGLSDEILELHPYAKDGTVIGPVTDLGASGERWQALSWIAELPPGTAVHAFVRASDTSFTANSSTPEWLPAGAETPVKTLPAGRFVQWRLTLSTGNSALTPTLLGVTCLFLEAKP